MHRLTKNRLRILDALVAEHVFGWKWFSALGDAFLIPPHGQEEARNFHVHWTEGLMEKKWRKCKKRYDIELHYTNYTRWELPHFSTLREDAFAILEHVGKSHRVGFWQREDSEYKGLWFVHSGGCVIWGLAETLPLAAVLFVLKLNNVKLPWKFKPKPRVKVA